MVASMLWYQGGFAPSTVFVVFVTQSVWFIAQFILQAAVCVQQQVAGTLVNGASLELFDCLDHMVHDHQSDPLLMPKQY